MAHHRVVEFPSRTILRTLLIVVAVAVALEVIWIARHVVAWVVIALFLALALNPFVGWIQRHTPLNRGSAIGLAGRYGVSGSLSRQATPVYTVSLHEAAPAFFEYAGGSLLYVQEDDTSLDPTKPFTSVAAAYAPVDGALPAPLPYPATP